MSEININHRINRVQQPDENSCWAACLVMVLESAGRKCYSVPGIISRAREGGVTVNANGTLDPSQENMGRLATAFNIRILTNRGTVRISDLEPILRPAPVILFGGFNYADRRTPLNHAVVLGGMWGDGSESTGISIIDPQNTRPGTDSSADDVFNWGDFARDIVDRLDYVSAIR